MRCRARVAPQMSRSWVTPSGTTVANGPACTASNRLAMFTSIVRDLRYAFRTLGRNPGFAFVSVLALALGIGANSAIFTVVNSVLLQPLRFHKPEQLVVVRERNLKAGFPQFSLSPGNYLGIPRSEPRLLGNRRVRRSRASTWRAAANPSAWSARASPSISSMCWAASPPSAAPSPRRRPNWGRTASSS